MIYPQLLRIVVIALTKIGVLDMNSIRAISNNQRHIALINKQNAAIKRLGYTNIASDVGPHDK